MKGIIRIVYQLKRIQRLLTISSQTLSFWQHTWQLNNEKIQHIFSDINKYLEQEQNKLRQLQKFIEKQKFQQLGNNINILKAYYEIQTIKEDITSLRLFEELEKLLSFYKALNQIESQTFKGSSTDISNINNEEILIQSVQHQKFEEDVVQIVNLNLKNESHISKPSYTLDLKQTVKQISNNWSPDQKILEIKPQQV